MNKTDFQLLHYLYLFVKYGFLLDCINLVVKLISMDLLKDRHPIRVYSLLYWLFVYPVHFLNHTNGNLNH